MSLLAPFTKKPKLTAAHQHTTQARNSTGGEADSFYNAAYSGYASVLLDDPIRAEALYSWGFALLHQAKVKPAGQAMQLLEEAISKFTFCLLINPNYLGAAIDMGVAYMDLARLQAASPGDALYSLAKNSFDNANRIQKGSASYNAACIDALRGDYDNALQALQYAKERGSLPDVTDILADADLDCVKQQAWFTDFVANLEKKPAVEATPATEAESALETTEAAQAAEPDAPVSAEQDSSEPAHN